MRFMTRLAAVAAVGVLGAMIAAPAATAGTTGVDYRGEFQGDIQVTGTCVDNFGNAGAPAGEVSGQWRANVGAKVVSARFVMFVDTVPHVVYTIPMTRVLDTDAVFEAKGQTGAGELIIKLTRDGTFTYTIRPYDTTPFWTPGYSCPGGVTFPGVLT